MGGRHLPVGCRQASWGADDGLSRRGEAVEGDRTAAPGRLEKVVQPAVIACAQAEPGRVFAQQVELFLSRWVTLVGEKDDRGAIVPLGVSHRWQALAV